MEYKVDERKIFTLMARKGFFVAAASTGLFLSVFTLILIFTGGLDIIRILPKILPFFLIPFLFLFVISFLGSGITKSKRWVIEDDFVIEYLNQEGLSSFNAYALRKAERRHGQQNEKMIRANQLDRVNFKKNGVTIRTKSYNFWNGNGGIEIPKEATNYDEIIEKLKIFQSRARP
jgi:ABC-type multidrug transport system fused ATPase/permease subunit